MNKKIQTIVTFILSVIIVFFGIRTFYIVFIIEKPQAEELNIAIRDNNIELAKELIKQVPHLYLGESVYSEEIVNQTNIDPGFFTKYLFVSSLDSLRESTDENNEGYNLFQEKYCSTSMKCYIVPKSYMQNYLETKFENLGLNLAENVSDEIIVIESDEEAFFVGINIQELGKYEKIGQAYQTEMDNEYYYIYEKVLFLYNVEKESNETMNTFKIKEIKLLPNDINKFDNIEISILSDNYEHELFTKYKEEVKLFKHTFKIIDNSYHWVETNIQ